jgi:hypothetical protein
MAAGQGFKTFTTGEVLTAGDVNGYLMQGVLVFASAAARNAAITSPQEGQFAFTKDTNGLWYYDGAAWVASGATGDIEGVTATSPLTGGGTSGTVTVGIQDASTSQRGSVQLSDSTSTTSSILAATPTAVKSSYDLAAAAIPKSTVTTAGDVIYATGSSAVTRLGIGSTGQVLTVTGGVPVWATAGGSSGPAFRASSTTGQSFSAATWTKVTLGTETFDTDNCFASSRFTPTKAGYYQLNVSMSFTPSTSSTNNFTGLYKNGTGYSTLAFNAATFELEVGHSGSDIMYFNGSTDYAEVYVFRNAGSGTCGGLFSGVWIRS